MGNALYLYGVFDSVNGIEAHSLARFDGTVWSPVFGLLRFSSSLNRVYDAEWFLGESYICGTFHKSGSNPAINGLAKWDGNEWVGVGPGLFGLFPGVNALATYRGKLVIAGHFNKYDTPGSIPGNGITMWDGQVWDTLQGGMAYRIPGGGVAGVAVHRDALYAYGLFDTAGGYPARNLAVWDGSRWCGLEESNDFVPTSIGFYHDTLFMTIGSESVGGMDSIIRFAKWIGSANTDGYRLVGVPEPVADAGIVTLFPNPAGDHFSLLLPPQVGSCTLRVWGVAGLEVFAERRYLRGEVDVSQLRAGVYFVEMGMRGGTQVVKLVKRN